MALVSHIDLDHITGILDLFRDMERVQDNGGERVLPGADALAQLVREGARGQGGDRAVGGRGRRARRSGAGGPEGKAAAVVASVRQGAELRDAAERLGTSATKVRWRTLVRAPEAGLRVITVAPGLTLTSSVRATSRLQELDEEWRRSEQAHPANPEAQAADYLNRTAPNLSSIVVLLEAARPNGAPPVRVLLTGDAGGDHILESLDTTGIGPAAGFTWISSRCSTTAATTAPRRTSSNGSLPTATSSRATASTEFPTPTRSHGSRRRAEVSRIRSS